MIRRLLSVGAGLAALGSFVGAIMADGDAMVLKQIQGVGWLILSELLARHEGAP